MYKAGDLIRIQSQSLHTSIGDLIAWIDGSLYLSFDQKNWSVGDVIIKMYVTNVIISCNI